MFSAKEKPVSVYVATEGILKEERWRMKSLLVYVFKDRVLSTANAISLYSV